MTHTEGGKALYKAAEYFSLEARQKVAAGNVFTERVPSFGKTLRRDPATRCCVVGALMRAEGVPGWWSMPTAGYVREQLLQHRGIKPEAGAIPALMKANDSGKLTTPEAVREALGV